MKLTKKSKYILFFCFFLFPFSVNAAAYYGVNTGAGVNIRNLPGTNGSVLKTSSLGEILDMPNNIKYESQQSCPNGWYQVYYSGTNVGYICSDYLKVYEKTENTEDNKTPTNDCEVAMQQAGFPSSYWNGLCSLKTSHPNWNFIPVKNADGTAIDWNMSVYSEASCGKNTISSKADASYINTSCNTNTDAGYSPASEAAVRYYLDPRNFFNEINIFMFEGQKTNGNISSDAYKTASTKIFGNSFLIQQIPGLPEYIKSASDATGISQTAIATRIRQELGSAKLTSGTYNGQLYSVVSGNYTSRYPSKVAPDGHSLDHYYNFYNIAAYDGSGVTEKAMNYAYSHGWGGTGNPDADRQTAVTGGAQFLNNKYINAGQNTIYFQKFNIYPTVTTSRYLNQYMSNIQGHVSESTITYNAYKEAGVLNSNFDFYIPVYSGMNVVDTPGETPNSDGKNSVNTIVNSAGFRYNNGFITNIGPGTQVADVKNALENIGGQNSVSITNANGDAVDGNIATGYRVTINGSSSETLIVVIYGDVSGDGNINALDLLKVQKHILGTAPLNGSSKEAADPSKDGNVNALDLLKIQKHILGSASIEQ